LNVSQDHVTTMDQPSVEFSDGSGHFFVMDVFHQLHCLNYLRKKTVLYSHLYPFEINDPEVPPEFHIRESAIQIYHISLWEHTDKDSPKHIALTHSASRYNATQI